MTMGWMETIQVLGLDLMVATVLAVAGLDAVACAIKAAWGRIPRSGAVNGITLSSVPCRLRPSARRSCT